MNSSHLSEPHFTAIGPISLLNTFSVSGAAVFSGIRNRLRLITHSKCPIWEDELHQCIKAAQAGSAFGLSTINDCSHIKGALNQSKMSVTCCLVLQPQSISGVLGINRITCTRLRGFKDTHHCTVSLGVNMYFILGMKGDIRTGFEEDISHQRKVHLYPISSYVSSYVDPGIPDPFLIISSSLDHISGRK